GNPNPILSSGQSAVKLWGTSSSNLYVVGNQGAIAFFNGSSWRKIESGTTLDIQDIWGSIDKKNNETEVIAVASNQWKSADRKILKISGMNCVMLSDNPLKYPLYSIYFESERKYYVAGDGIFEKKLLSDSIWRNKPFDFAQYFIFRIRGSNLNNVIAVGGYGEAVHFNGSSWKSYHDIVGIGYGNYYSVDIKNKMIIIVGQEYPKAIIAVGKRK
ncbi:MAG: glucosyl transferase, partial [Ignavibacteriales bacterium]|nr:glucosyl transferase [Ignavibacteriales bacterium]